MDDTRRERKVQLMALMKAEPGLSLAEMAERLDLRSSDGSPYKMLVHRMLKALKDEM
jgi:DNA-binding IclR family transcriptional regulator